MWPQVVLAAAAQIRDHRVRACAGAGQVSPGYPCAGGAAMASGAILSEVAQIPRAVWAARCRDC